VIAQELPELADCLILVRSEILGNDQLRAGPVGPDLLAAVPQWHQERVMRDLDVVLYFFP